MFPVRTTYETITVSWGLPMVTYDHRQLGVANGNVDALTVRYNMLGCTIWPLPPRSSHS